MNKTLLEIIDDLVEEHGTEGAIDHIFVNDWPLDTKSRAIDMLEKRKAKTSTVEHGEINPDEFFK